MINKIIRKKNFKIAIAIILGLIIVVSSILLFKEATNKEDKKEKKTTTKTTTTAKPKLTIFNEDSNQRTYAVMIDNVSGAFPQAGVQDAFLTYEISVEGGLTRLLAIFKDKDIAMIGPVRSARHYYLDYVEENNSIYVHFGFSPQAEQGISSRRINNLSGTGADGAAFWRDSSRTVSPHNAFTSSKKILTAASKKYKTETGYTPILNYSVDEVSLESRTDKVLANTVRIPYSGSQLTSYSYNTSEKVYYRYNNNRAHMDRNINKQVHVKNIIVIQVRNTSLNDGSGKDRQELYNEGTGTGYYITNGYAVPITWSKTAHSAKTIYKYSDGKEIVVNDGNTYVQIQPLGKVTTFE